MLIMWLSLIYLFLKDETLTDFILEWNYCFPHASFYQEYVYALFSKVHKALLGSACNQCSYIQGGGWKGGNESKTEMSRSKQKPSEREQASNLSSRPVALK